MTDTAIELQLFEELMHLPHRIRRNILHAEPHGNRPHRDRGPHCTAGGEPPFRMHEAPREDRQGMPHRHHPQGMRPFAQERVMEELLKYEEGARQKELAEAMRINPSSMSELIEKLRADGYVERTVDPEDRRATRITLTELGRARAYETSDERAEKIRPVFAGLTEEEKQELLRLLRKLTASSEEE